MELTFPYCELVLASLCVLKVEFELMLGGYEHPLDRLLRDASELTGMNRVY